MNNLVLSIFPGIDILGNAFEDEGYCVVKGGEPMFGQRGIESFRPPAGVFEGVIGGPPCKGDSLLAHLNGSPSIGLFHEFERVVDMAQPDWWLMEAVRPHRDKHLGNIVALSPRWLGKKQSRWRYFHTNLDILPHLEGWATLEDPVFKHAVLAGHGGAVGSVYRGMAKYSWAEMCALQGLPADYDIPCLTKRFRQEVVGNAVQYDVARALARALRRATGAPGHGQAGG